MYDSLSVLWFVARILIHAGMIISVWGFKDDAYRYRYHVNLFAIAFCGTNAVIVLSAFRDLHSKGFDLFSLPITFLVFCLYLAVLSQGGNIAFMLRPIEKVYFVIKGFANAKH